MQNAIANSRRNNFDVANIVNVTDPVAVADAVESIFLNLFPNASTISLRNAMSDISQLRKACCERTSS